METRTAIVGAGGMAAYHVAGFRGAGATVTSGAWNLLGVDFNNSARPEAMAARATYANGLLPAIVFVAHGSSHDGKAVVSVGQSEDVRRVVVDGNRAAWVGGNMLVWERASVSYLIGGKGLSLSAALAMAASH